MTEYDYWKIFPRMPKKVTIGDITVRDGFQHLEKFISTAAKITYLEELIFAGCRNIEVTNLGNPRDHAEVRTNNPGRFPGVLPNTTPRQSSRRSATS